MFEVNQLGVVGAWSVLLIVMALMPFAVAFRRVRSRRERLSSGSVADTAEVAAEEVAEGVSPRSYRNFAQAALGEFSSARLGLLGGSRSESLVARDYSLCTCILMAAFENDSQRALSCAAQLAHLPLDGERHQARREAVISVARVLAGVVDEEDWEHLGRAPTHEPVLLWTCRYAVAQVLHSTGRDEQVEALIGAAPRWPDTSHFAKLHQELCEHCPGLSQAAEAA